MKKLKFDSYDGVCFLNGLVFFAPVALLVRTLGTHIFPPSGIIVRRDFSGGNSNRIYNR